MKKFFFLALSGLFIFHAAFCSTVDTAIAKVVATNFLLSRASQSSLPNARSIAAEGVELTLVHQEYDESVSPANTQPYYYVYNVKGNKGFVIVSADDAVVPVLGYSFNGKYDPANEAPAFTEWMQQYKQQITMIKANPSEASGSISQKWQEGRTTARSIQAETPIVEVAPLVTAQWNQGCYYNQYCPQDVNSKYCERTLVGCVAVAMGQIINYHKYPDACADIPGYTDENNGKTSYGWIDNIPATTYNWSDMADKLNDTSSEQQIDAVGKLLYHCGVAVKMDYGTSVSGAFTKDVPAALCNYFKYSTSAQYIDKENYSALDWKEILKNELDNNRPVLYAASFHAFVCDGYQDNDYFHFNWGWGGQDDNYFYIHNIVIGEDDDYNWFPSAVIGINKVSVPFIRITGNELQDGSAPGSTGNSNNLPEPGETIRIPVTMTNSSSVDAANVTAVLSCSDPNVTILNSTQNWVNIHPDSIITTDFRFSISSASVSTIDTITLTVTSGTERWVKVYPFNIYKNIAVEVSEAGKLHTLVTPAERSSLLSLSISGTIDARDFVTLRDSFPMLEILDMSDATIAAYEGTEGTTVWDSIYPANTIPICSFFSFDTYRAKVSLTSVTLPSSLTTVGMYAFYTCNRLTSVHFPQTLHSIEMSAFVYTNLASIILPDSVSFLGSDAFSSCTQLTSVVLSTDLDSIGSGVFNSCDALNDISISQQNKKYSVADGILFNKDATTLLECLTSKSGNCTVPEGVTLIADNAFFSNGKLTTVSLPSTLVTIGKSAFEYCWDLTSVTLPDNLASIGEKAFKDCGDITLFSASDKNKFFSVEDGVLLNKDKTTLIAYPSAKSTKYVIPESVTSIGAYAFYGCSDLDSLIISNHVTTIGNCAFNGCSGLLSLLLPASLTTIDEQALSGCSKLQTLTFPAGLTSIGDNAFSYCQRLADIHCQSVIPPFVGESAFEGLPDSTTLYVPSGSYSAYATATEWSNFTIIKEEEVTSVPETADAENLILYAVRDAIVLEGIQPGTLIAVYSETGVRVQTVVALTDPVRINLPAGHTYLISVAGKTLKVAL